MASAWGEAWGAAFGSSWNAVAAPSTAGAGGLIRRAEAERLYEKLQTEDAALNCRARLSILLLLSEP